MNKEKQLSIYIVCGIAILGFILFGLIPSNSSLVIPASIILTMISVATAAYLIYSARKSYNSTNKEKRSDIRYVESLRKRADAASASANHRALVIADLTRKLEAANKIITELKSK